MAVFTPLTEAQVDTFLERYTTGRLELLEEVASGTENSTFFVTTDQARLVLTLFEQGETDELPFFIELLEYLDSNGVAVTNPLKDRDGNALQQLAGRPALLLPRLEGEHPMAPTLSQCHTIGAVMGKMHQCTRHYRGSRPNPRDLRWIDAQYPKVMAYLKDEDKQLMQDTVDALESDIGYHPDLPSGALHGDLFRDNAMFNGDTFSGLIDFYNGCTGHFLFDLAILVNDWCSNADGSIDPEKYTAVLEGYLAERNLTALERTLWKPMLALTALRYWLSRLLVVYVDPPAHELTPKPPEQYRALLLARIEAPVPDLPR